ncbi:MAG: hypothetical protein CSA94_02130, partial [Bacteroidetes bacterium]
MAIFSCSNKKKPEKECKVISVFDLKAEKFQPKSGRVLCLETSDSCLLGEQVKILQNNNADIFVGDFSANKTVFRFNNKGKFINKIGHKGQGPKEYPLFHDFIVYNDTISIISKKGTKSNIYSYTNSGKFVANLEVEVGSYTLGRLGDKYLLNTSYNPSSYSHRLYTFNLKGEKCAAFLPYPEKIFDMSIYDPNFSNIGTAILYRQLFDRYIYEYRNNQLKKKYEFDFGKYAIPMSFFEEGLMQGYKALQKNGFGDVHACFESSKYAVFYLVVRPGGKSPVQFEYIVLNKTSNQLKRYSFAKADNYLGTLVGLNHNNELVFKVNA